MFIGKKLLHEGAITMLEIHQKYKEKDGYLYVHFA